VAETEISDSTALTEAMVMLSPDADESMALWDEARTDWTEPNEEVTWAA